MLVHSIRHVLRRSRTSVRGLLRPLIQIFFFLPLTAVPAKSQVVTGHVFGDNQSEPLGGAVVILMTANGERVRGVLSNDDGRFIIPAAPGSYKLHAEMIGRRTAESDAFTVGSEPAIVNLALALQPVRLEGVVVKASSRCSTGADVGEATLQVWEEVKKALQAEAVTRELAMYEFDIKQTRRVIDPNTYQVVDKAVSQGKSVAQSPFRTLPPAEIKEHGYAKTVDGQTMIYGPNTEVLLSHEFEETHCFSLKQKKDRVGLVFKPVKGRKVTDIEGVIWVDGKTAELQRIEFDYKRVPWDLVAGRYSGFAEFQRLECGAWIIGHWRLSTPATMAEAEVTSLERVQTAQVTDDATDPATGAENPTTAERSEPQPKLP